MWLLPIISNKVRKINKKGAPCLPCSLLLRKLRPMHISRIPGPLTCESSCRWDMEVRTTSLWQLQLLWRPSSPHTDLSFSTLATLSALTPSKELGGLLVCVQRYSCLVVSLYLGVKSPSIQCSLACSNRSMPLRILNKKVFLFKYNWDNERWRHKLQTPPKIILYCYKPSFQHATKVSSSNIMSLSDDKQNE